MKKPTITQRVLAPLVAQPDDTNKTGGNKKISPTSLMLFVGNKVRITAVGPLAVISVSVISTLAIVATVLTKLPIV